MTSNFSSRSDRGITLIETLATVVIVGILAAATVPNLMPMYEKKQVAYAIEATEGAIQTAQSEAIRKSRTCDLAINSVNNTINSTNACLVSGNLSISNLAAGQRNLTQVNIRSNTPSFNFNFRGVAVDSATPPNQLTAPIVVVLSHSQNANIQQCLVVSVPLGLIRKGTYPVGDSTTLDANCTTP